MPSGGFDASENFALKLQQGRPATAKTAAAAMSRPSHVT
jgi:hypothetical protein